MMHLMKQKIFQTTIKREDKIMGKEFISERQAAILLMVSARSIKNWRDKGCFDSFKIVNKTEKRVSVFYTKYELLLWFRNYINQKKEKKPTGKKLKYHQC